MVLNIGVISEEGVFYTFNDNGLSKFKLQKKMYQNLSIPKNPPLFLKNAYLVERLAISPIQKK